MLLTKREGTNLDMIDAYLKKCRRLLLCGKAIAVLLVRRCVGSEVVILQKIAYSHLEAMLLH